MCPTVSGVTVLRHEKYFFLIFLARFCVFQRETEKLTISQLCGRVLLEV